MLTFSRRRVLTLAAGIFLLPLLTPGAAQAALKHKAPAHSRLDPQARAVLTAMTSAYKALTSYSATLSVASAGGGHTQRQTVALSFLRPDRARITMSDAAGLEVEVVANQSGLFLFSPRDNQYDKRYLMSANQAIPATLSQVRGTLLPTLTGSPEFLSRLLNQPGAALTLGAPKTIGGAATDTVVLAPASDPGSQVRIILSIGQGDHLLRRLTESVRAVQGGQTQTLMHVETVTKQALDPSLAASFFAFVPPPGAQGTIEPPPYDLRLKPGVRPFPLAAADLNGHPLSLDQYRGKVVLVDFWATWCGPCMEEMPDVIAAYKKYHAQGFDIVGVSLDQDRHTMAAFLNRNKMPWRQVFAGRGWLGPIPRRYGVMEIPFALLLNRDGTISDVGVDSETLTGAIKKALARG